MSKLDFESMKFSLLFLGMTPPESVPEDPKDRVPPLGVIHSCCICSWVAVIEVLLAAR